MRVFAIDPGNIDSAYAILNPNTYEPLEIGKVPNEELLLKILFQVSTGLVVPIEMIASYGMPVGKEVFDTCVWIGRFEQAAYTVSQKVQVPKVFRAEVKLNLCQSPRAKDSNVTQALKDRFGQVGTKKSPGWFYGFHHDIWSAYAVGVTYLDKLKEEVVKGAGRNGAPDSEADDLAIFSQGGQAKKSKRLPEEKGAQHTSDGLGKTGRTNRSGGRRTLAR